MYAYISILWVYTHNNNMVSSIKNTGNQSIIFSVNEHERHYLSELKLTHGDKHYEPTF